jgi:hypothetical protein
MAFEKGRASSYCRPWNPTSQKTGCAYGRNPATGEAIKIKPSKKVAFRAAKDLKMAV